MSLQCSDKQLWWSWTNKPSKIAPCNYHEPVLMLEFLRLVAQKTRRMTPLCHSRCCCSQQLCRILCKMPLPNGNASQSSYTLRLGTCPSAKLLCRCELRSSVHMEQSTPPPHLIPPPWPNFLGCILGLLRAVQIKGVLVGSHYTCTALLLACLLDPAPTHHPK